MSLSRWSLLVMMCTLGVSAPSVLEGQDVAAAFSLRTAPIRTLVFTPMVTTPATPRSAVPMAPSRRDSSAALGQNYLPEQLRVRDSVVRRWSDRTTTPVRVWIQPARALNGWDDAFPAMAKQALDQWQTVDLPVRFTVVTDSSAAELHILWTDRLGQDESGRTVWWSTTSGWITRARVTLSTHASDGLPQTPRALRAVALHEIGHAIGLGHTSDARNIMAPWVEVTELSTADRNTATLLYQLPAGRVTAQTAQTAGEAGAMQRRDGVARSATPE